MMHVHATAVVKDSQQNNIIGGCGHMSMLLERIAVLYIPLNTIEIHFSAAPTK